ncbi:hypothetical protein BGZ96_007093 [Linnemannia gamsii]|uniref:Lipid-binding serum glycoprotein C-terminal domain-containing protein n=1 Tax=Linnemannia gamsii TaxID=64522 RepID=A0ABQ7K252_9FUNG|nr:hypothetical protein BGZ96_007093 [Linnemannia gamsii]
MNGSQMEMDQLNISEPTETGMWVSLKGGVKHGGLFPATIVFPEAVVVSWNDGQDLGQMEGLEDVEISGGQGEVVDGRTRFEILDQKAFSDFAKELLTKEKFVWRLKSVVTVKVLGLMSFSGIKLVKDVTLLGMNGFGKITIQKFDLPRDAPNNQGAVVKLVTLMNNPSPIGMTLGSIVLDLFYEGTHLGQVTAQNATLVGGGSESPLELEGVLFRQASPENLAHLSALFSNYLAGRITMTTAKGVSVKPDGVNPVSWLSDGILALTLTVPLQSAEPLQIIHGIQIMDMGIAFNNVTPYAPTVLSNSMTAGVKFPFNITIHVQTITNLISLGYWGKILGDIPQSIPSQANSNIPNLIGFSLPPSPLVVKSDAHEAFNTFLADLTTLAEDTFSVVGKSNATAETPMGLVTLTDVPFNSPVTMRALNFNTQHTTVSDVVVSGGTSEHIIINVVVALTNPSTLTVTIGNVKLSVFDGTTSQFLGDLVIQNLNIVPGGPTSVPAQFLFHPLDAVLRDQFLTRFVAGDTFPLHVTGSPTGSTPLPELQKALSLLSLSCSVGGLNPPPLLFPSGRATSTLNTILGSHTTAVWVDIQNPLPAPMFCTSIVATVTWRGDLFGTINQPVEFLIPGSQGRATTPELTLQHPGDLGFSAFLTTQFLPVYPGVAIGGGAMVPFEMDLQFGVRIGGEGGYAATISYKQRIEIMVKMTVLGIDVGGVINGVTNVVGGVVNDVAGGIVNGVAGGVLKDVAGGLGGLGRVSGGGGSDGSSSGTSGRVAKDVQRSVGKVVGGLTHGLL